MTLPAIWNQTVYAVVDPTVAAAIVNHLWQSTAFALAAWLLALALRNNRAGVRYCIWLAASIKFLVPFSLLVAAGATLRPSVSAPIRRTAVTVIVEQFSRPFTAALPPASPSLAFGGHGAGVIAIVLAALWAFGFVAVAIRWRRQWLQIRAAIQNASPRGIVSGVPIVSAASVMEPGMFGIVKPVLVVPEGILDKLPQPQFEAIVAHELCHVKRRDNLTFALHMVVESIFWFHPLVWWLGARLIEERELACDEAVLRSGNAAEDYAEGILNVCRFYLESPLACAAGVTGSDLKRRIVRILAGQSAQRLSLGRRLMLGAAVLGAVAIPLAIGVLRGSPVHAQSPANIPDAEVPKFDVASIKPSKSEDGRVMLMFRPDGVAMTGVPVQMILLSAFAVNDDRLLNAPGWAKSDHYDIEAKVAPEDAPKLDKLTREQRFGMLRVLLEERFGLKFHHETRELPVYNMQIAKGGVKIHPAAPDGDPSSGTQPHHSTLTNGRGNIEGKGSSIENLAHVLSMQLGRTIFDKTGLTGEYDYSLNWTPDDGAAPPAPGSGPGNGPQPEVAAPSLFTAIQEQLGLKLESEKGQVDVIVIDHIDKPTAN